MRLARLADYKRRIQTQSSTWHLKLKRFAFANVPSLGTAEVSLTLPFLILSGPNGVGKTTVLRAIWAAADPSSARPSPGASLKLTTGSATLDYEWNSKSESSEIHFTAGEAKGGSGLQTGVVHLDASSDPLRYQRSFCTFSNYEDITNGVGPSLLDDKTLAEINYICRRQYKGISVYEVEDGEAVVPFFEVQVGGDRYDSRTMGAGELTALHTWWTVNRASDNSLLLIEEPETFLSPASQQGLAHFLLASTVDKRLVTIITSHSAKIIESVADEHRLFLYREGESARFAPVPVTPSLLATVGIEPIVGVLIMVEDEAASLFLRLLLEYCDPTFARTCEISVQDGEGNIVAALTRIGGSFRAVRIAGVFDGDQRGKVSNSILPFSAFLPGDVAIEKVFRDLVTTNVPASSMALSKPKLSEILFAAQGVDHHDWYMILCKELGLSKHQLFPILFDLWLKDTGSEEAAFETLKSLKAVIARKPAKESAF